MVTRISILIFNQVEILDFAGPLEVFNTARQFWNGPPPQIELVAPDHESIRTVGNMRVHPDRHLNDCLHTDLLVVPGGAGTRPLLEQEATIAWIRERARQSILTLSICTGALLLGRARLLDGRNVTTHHSAFDELRTIVPSATIQSRQRYVDTGKIITAAGISAGIDAALYTVAKINGRGTAMKTAVEMEYDWQ